MKFWFQNFVALIFCVTFNFLSDFFISGILPFDFRNKVLISKFCRFDFFVCGIWFLKWFMISEILLFDFWNKVLILNFVALIYYVWWNAKQVMRSLSRGNI